ncbi:hypothetical protein [Paraburkholderia caribensis]|uniref:hypothetical protein n=1 Tax=Paraburkholderia caribensis TaxID=75105 RepID=UPI001591B7DB|nr:hypothetical protein [Paraburkholderia caribensis]
MSIQLTSESRSILEATLFSAVSHISNLNLSLDDGSYPVIPAVTLWVMEKSEPSLMSDVDERGLRDHLMQLLEEYRRLDEHALSPRKRLWYDNIALHHNERAPFRLEFHEIAEAFYQSGFVATDLFREIFDATADDLFNHFEEGNVIEWGDPEPASSTGTKAGLESESVPVFDHYKAYWDADQYPKDLEPLDFAVKLLVDDLGRMDDGRHEDFWTTVDSSVVVSWLERERSTLHGILTERNCIDRLHNIVVSYVASQCEVEHWWASLGYPLRYSMRQHADSREVVSLIAAVLEVNDVIDRIGPEEVYDMFCRRHVLPNVTRVAPLRETISSTGKRCRVERAR